MRAPAPRTIPAIAASAAGWPRVRAPSIGGSAGSRRSRALRGVRRFGFGRRPRRPRCRRSSVALGASPACACVVPPSARASAVSRVAARLGGRRWPFDAAAGLRVAFGCRRLGVVGCRVPSVVGAGTRPACAVAFGFGVSAVAAPSRAGRPVAASAGFCATCARSMRLELRRDLAPLARARARRAAAPPIRRGRRPTAAARGRRERSWPPGGGRPAADVRVAVDPATAAAAVALALHRRLVGRPAAAGTAAAATATAAGAAAALLGDQVLGDLRLVEVLVVRERREAAGRGRGAGVPSCESQTEPNGVGRAARGARPRASILVASSSSVSASSRAGPTAPFDGIGAAPRLSRLRRGLGLGHGLDRHGAAAAPARRRRRRVRRSTLAGDAVDGLAIEIVEGEDLGRGQVGLGQAARRATGARRAARRRPPSAALRPRRPAASTARVRDCGSGAATGSGSPGRPRPRPPRPAATTDAGALGLLVRDLGHRQVLAVVGDAATGRASPSRPAPAGRCR